MHASAANPWLYYQVNTQSMDNVTRGDGDPLMGQCMRCKEKREMKDIEEVTMKTGMKAAKGKCTQCDCGMYKILGKA